MSLQNKNRIKNRMVKKAAELWGVSPNDIESTFDPVVALLIGACASELSKISTEVNASQSRITEKLIELMAPETSAGSQPAHAIAHSIPIEPYTDIVPANQLYGNKKAKNRDGDVSHKTAYFSPIRPFKLVNSYIQYALVANKMLSFHDEKKSIKTDVLHIAKDQKLGGTTVYLGIAKTISKISLRDTSLFFELNDVSNQELFYNQLQQAKFFFNEEPLEVAYGFHDIKTQDHLNVDHIFSDNSQKSFSLENQTSLLYKKHYITISKDCFLNSTPHNPDLLGKIDAEKHEDFEEFHWIKVVFPSLVTSNILSNIYVALNTFPVLNRRLESTTYKLKDFTNIIPFSTTDLFLDIRRITNDHNREYTVLASNKEEKKGTYTVRDEGIGRLDSKKAKDHLTNLIELLKNESAAFSVLGDDFLHTNIKNLNQNISALEGRVSDMSLKIEENHYLSIRPFGTKETIFVEFWSTIGKKANLMRAGTKLQVYKGSDIETKTCFLVTSTSQGRNSLTSDERLYKYRRMLLSRDRIVTKEDVKALCFDVCGTKIESVTLTKTFRTLPDYDKGLVPAFVITMKKNSSTIVKDTEWGMIKNNILAILEEKSTNIFPYHIELIA